MKKVTSTSTRQNYNRKLQQKTTTISVFMCEGKISMILILKLTNDLKLVKYLLCVWGILEFIGKILTCPMFIMFTGTP